MKQVSVVNVNGNNYLLIKRIEDYVYFVNEQDEEDFFIKKVIKKDDGEQLISLADEAEFDKALELFKNNCEL